VARPMRVVAHVTRSRKDAALSQAVVAPRPLKIANRLSSKSLLSNGWRE